MTTSPDIQSERRKRSFLSKLCQAMFILTLLAAVAGCDLYAVRTWQQFRAARSWPRVTGVIRGSNTHRTGWNRDEIRYVTDISYRYTVGYATYAATNRLPQMFSTAFDADNAVQALRAKGGYLPVFYNPHAPADSALSQEYPNGVSMCFGILTIATVLALAWFGRRLVRLATGREDYAIIHSATPQSDSDPGMPAGPWQSALRWGFALLGAVSCWWMALMIYRNWSLPSGERTLPSADLILVMEFILMHSGIMVAGVLSKPGQAREAKIKSMLFLGLVYLVFVMAIASAGHSVLLFVTFSGILASRWADLLLDSDKARQQQMTRSMEGFLIFFFCLIVFLWLLKLPLDVTLVIYFCLIGIFEATLPARKRSWFRPPTVQGG